MLACRGVRAKPAEPERRCCSFIRLLSLAVIDWRSDFSAASCRLRSLHLLFSRSVFFATRRWSSWKCAYWKLKTYASRQ
jgi:hypothetical protein